MKQKYYRSHHQSINSDIWSFYLSFSKMQRSEVVSIDKQTQPARIIAWEVEINLHLKFSSLNVRPYILLPPVPCKIKL